MKSLIIIVVLFCLTLSGCMEAIPITYFTVVAICHTAHTSAEADKVDKETPQLEEKVEELTVEKPG